MKKAAERRSKIIKILDDFGKVNVTELSQEFDVSEVTIRNDLDKLEKSNLLIRAHGGAFKTSKLALTVSEKKGVNQAAKRLIGGRAATLIEEEDSIILDSGTTTFEISGHLGNFKKLTVISNALDIVNNLSQFNNLQVYMPGGYLKEFSMSLVGPMAERNLRQLHCRKLFLGVDGIKTETGIYTHHMEEAYLNQIMMEISEEVILVADSSKFKKTGLAFISAMDKVDKIITDDGLDQGELYMLEKHNVEVIIV